MKVLTVGQPYASAIMEALKPVENRAWKTSYRGTLVIHAGLSKKWLHMTPKELRIQMKVLGNWKLLPFGALLGTVELDDIVFYGHERAMHSNPFAYGPLCWILENPKQFKTPIPYKGRQGLWNIPDEIIKKALI